MSKYRQDLPPAGGFGTHRYEALLPKKGFSNITLMAITIGITSYGLAKYIYYQKQENEIRNARIAEREAFIPRIHAFLQEEREKEEERFQSTVDRAVAKRKVELEQGTNS